MSGKKTLARWMLLTSLAKAAGVEERTVRRWLKEPGAPMANQRGLYPSHKCFDFFASLGRDGKGDSEGAAVKLRRAHAQLALEEFKVKKEMGAYVEKELIGPTLEALWAEVVKGMRDSFEFELPSKYRGKTAVECQQMNIAAIDAIIARFKQGALPIT